jgi:hypothetical protein
MNCGIYDGHLFLQFSSEGQGTHLVSATGNHSIGENKGNLNQIFRALSVPFWEFITPLGADNSGRCRLKLATSS